MVNNKDLELHNTQPSMARSSMQWLSLTDLEKKRVAFVSLKALATLSGSLAMGIGVLALAHVVFPLSMAVSLTLIVVPALALAGSILAVNKQQKRSREPFQGSVNAVAEGVIGAVDAMREEPETVESRTDGLSVEGDSDSMSEAEEANVVQEKPKTGDWIYQKYQIAMQEYQVALEDLQEFEKPYKDTLETARQNRDIAKQLIAAIRKEQGRKGVNEFLTDYAQYKNAIENLQKKDDTKKISEFDEEYIRYMQIRDSKGQNPKIIEYYVACQEAEKASLIATQYFHKNRAPYMNKKTILRRKESAMDEVIETEKILSKRQKELDHELSQFKESCHVDFLPIYDLYKQIQKDYHSQRYPYRMGNFYRFLREKNLSADAWEKYVAIKHEKEQIDKTLEQIQLI